MKDLIIGVVMGVVAMLAGVAYYEFEKVREGDVVWFITEDGIWKQEVVK